MDKLEHESLIQLVIGIAMKPWLSRSMLPNIKIWGNWWSNFSENLRVVALKLLELTQFASPNLWIYFNFVRCWGPLWLRAIFHAQFIYWEVYENSLFNTLYLSMWPRGRVDDLSFFEYLSLFCFLSIEFHCTFSISYKILPYFVYYYCI